MQIYVYIYISDSGITTYKHIPDNYWPLKIYSAFLSYISNSVKGFSLGEIIIIYF